MTHEELKELFKIQIAQYGDDVPEVEQHLMFIEHFKVAERRKTDRFDLTEEKDLYNCRWLTTTAAELEDLASCCEVFKKSTTPFPELKLIV